jgi:hypothetical protein
MANMFLQQENLIKQQWLAVLQQWSWIELLPWGQ